MSLSYESDVPPSSPPAGASTGTLKTRKPPPITPRRFNRFFNPRIPSSGESTSSHALRELTTSALNARHGRNPTMVEAGDYPCPRPSKKRRRQSSPANDVHRHALGLPSSPVQLATPPPSSPPLRSSPCPMLEGDEYTELNLDLDEDGTSEDVEEDNVNGAVEEVPLYPEPIARSRTLQRFVPQVPWQSQVSDFVSKPEDRHVSSAPPYCSTACHTNSLIAIGDEGGSIVLLDTDSSADFTKTFLQVPTGHANAIMDVTFSADDSLLATVGGDKLGNVIDVRSQKTIFTLADGHTATPKQVAFQPGHDHMLATCGRDGRLQIWDLRCKTSAATAQLLRRPYQHVLPRDFDCNISSKHRFLSSSKGFIPCDLSSPSVSMRYKRKQRYISSITSMSFHPLANHLFTTSTAESPELSTWDIRSRFFNSKDLMIHPPISKTTVLGNYGISHTTFSPSGRTLYAVAKNSSIQAYATSQLILGQVASSDPSSRPWALLRKEREAGGMSHDLRHPELNVSSFYVRAAVRPARGDQSEVLAVGSSTGSPVLFPVDEHAPASRRLRQEARQGVALVRGHEAEVTSTAWTVDGSMVSVSDDGSVRVWREDGEEAEVLRRGEAGGRRWLSGWADVGEDDGEEEG